MYKRQSSASLQCGTPGCQDRWSWSDALFMSPPVFVKLACLGDSITAGMGVKKEDCWVSRIAKTLDRNCLLYTSRCV